MKTKKLKEKDHAIKKALLTPREEQCINLILGKNTVTQIAEILKISERTVYFYLMNLSNKFCKMAMETIKPEPQNR